MLRLTGPSLSPSRVFRAHSSRTHQSQNSVWTELGNMATWPRLFPFLTSVGRRPGFQMQEIQFPWASQVALVVKEPTCQCRRLKKRWFDPWVEKIPWKKAWQPTPVFLPGESQEPGGLQSIGLQTVEYNWSNLAGIQIRVPKTQAQEQQAAGGRESDICSSLGPTPPKTVLLYLILGQITLFLFLWWWKCHTEFLKRFFFKSKYHYNWPHILFTFADESHLPTSSPETAFSRAFTGAQDTETQPGERQGDFAKGNRVQCLWLPNHTNYTGPQPAVSATASPSHASQIVVIYLFACPGS